VKLARSAILELPSVIIPGEFNYLLNTTHPDFKTLTIGKPSASRSSSVKAVPLFNSGLASNAHPRRTRGESM
jgi:hypothetical protein